MTRKQTEGTAGDPGLVCRSRSFTGQPARISRLAESERVPTSASRASRRLEGIATMISAAKQCRAFRKARPGAVFPTGASQHGIELIGAPVDGMATDQ